jgi:hypothetical protein
VQDFDWLFHTYHLLLFLIAHQVPLQLAYQQPGEKKKLRINPDIVGFGELGEISKEG